MSNRRKIETVTLTEENNSKLHPSTLKESTDKSPTASVVWKILRPVAGVLIAVLVVGVLLKLGYDFAYNKLLAPVDEDSTEVIEVSIANGSSLSAISNKLEEEGIIRSSTAFKLYVDFSDMSSKLLAGKFELSPSMTFDEIVKILKRPTSINDTMMITLREGYTAEKMANSLVDVGLFRSVDEYLEAARTGEAFTNYDFVKEVIVANGKKDGQRKYILEGYLFPDKYEVYTDTDAETVINKQLARFDQIFNDEYKARAKEIGLSVDQVVTLASIIEREGSGEDMPKISAVFHNRLKQNMPLQSDATVLYITGESKLIVTSEETSIDSPYNTYKNTGLPIGPICNPSAAAIEAALYPDNSILSGGYLYFCLGDPETGEVFYSKTLAEHSAIQEKYKEKWAEWDAKNKADEEQ